MSIQLLRDSLVHKRRNDKNASIRRRSSRLRVLNTLTHALTTRVGLPHAVASDFNSTPPTPDEIVFLDRHDLSKGDCPFPDAYAEVKPEAANQPFSKPWSKSGLQLTVDSHSPEPELVEIHSPAHLTDRTTRSRAANAVDDHDGDKAASSKSPQIPDSDDHDSTSSPLSDTPINSAVTPKPANHSPATSLDDHPAALPNSPDSVKFGASADDSSGPSTRRVGHVVRRHEEHADEDMTDAAAGAGTPTAGTDTVITTDIAEQKGETLVHPELPASKQHAPSPATPVQAHDRSQRMQTRVSSGAMRQKSVAEIMHETPKTSIRRKASALLREPSSTSQSPRTTPSRPARDSMPAPPRPSRPASTLATIPSRKESTLPFDLDAFSTLIGAADDPSRDYLEPLYRIQAQDPPNGRSLVELVHKASKSISTNDQLVCYKERQDHRILKRIYGLQYANHWSLRQMQPCPEPPTPKTHWDHVIAEAKWMRTDFRQERKEKRALAKFLAIRCAEWVAADTAARLLMQVKARKPEPLQQVLEPADEPQSPAATHVDNPDNKDDHEDGVPELDEPNKDDHSSPEADMLSPTIPHYAIVPDTMFSALSIGEDTAHLLESEDFVRIVNDLPLYAPFSEDDGNAPGSNMKLISQATPSVSKFSSNKIITKASSFPRKRTRYDYEESEEEDATEGQDSKRMRASSGQFGLPPEQVDVALFDMEHKPIKDRLRASNMFRPPSEFNMPGEKFYEWRLASQWTWEDDHKLRKLAKEFSFNWSLVANQMALPSHFHGAADRRTPWECFERWIELETLPNDMRKTVYFRTWHQRMETAARQVDARYQAQLQLHAQNNNPAPPPMKRRTMPARVERRRTGRYLHVIDAMRKLARKREQQQHKQAEAQKAASMRKQHEPTQPTKTTVHTPQEFSRLRHERDVQMQLRTERMRENMLAQQKAAQMQRAGNPAAQQAILAAQQRQGQSGQAQNAQMQPGQTAGQMQLPNGLPVQNRNGQVGVPQMGMQSNAPQAQMQTNMRSNNSATGQMTQEQIQRMALQAQMKGSAVPNPQQMKQYQQQMMNTANHGVMNGQMNNQAAMLAAIQASQNGMGNAQLPNGSSTTNGMSVSPHMPPPNPSQPKQLSSGHIPAISQIKHSLQAAHPQATPQQIDQMANEQMKRHIQATQAKQNAANAAAGSYANLNNLNQMGFQQQNGTGGQANGFNNANGSTQQQYSQLMRQRLMQQQQQQQGQPQQGQQNGGSSASPRLQQASPANMHISPVIQQAVPHMANGMARPPSRNTATPMARIPSSGSMPSPGLAQGSPRPQMVKQT